MIEANRDKRVKPFAGQNRGDHRHFADQSDTLNGAWHEQYSTGIHTSASGTSSMGVPASFDDIWFWTALYMEKTDLTVPLTVTLIPSGPSFSAMTFSVVH